MNKTIAGALLLIAASMLAGCQTMKGMGEDIQGGGRSIERAADKAS